MELSPVVVWLVALVLLLQVAEFALRAGRAMFRRVGRSSKPDQRARFMAMTGLAPRVARRTLSGLLHFGVLKAATSRAPVAFAVPLKSLRFLFPRLWPEAEADGAD